MTGSEGGANHEKVIGGMSGIAIASLFVVIVVGVVAHKTVTGK